jgi:anti-anti-sigma factor
MALVEVIQTEGDNPVTVFKILDRVNLGNYKELEQAAQTEFDNGMRRLVIDLSASDSLTSIGIRALVVIHKMLKSADGVLKMAGVKQPIKEMLEVAGITQFIEMYDTVDEAVASI